MSNLGLDRSAFNRYARQGRKASVTGLPTVIRYLRRYQPETLKAIRNDIRSEIRPIMSPIVNEINSEVTSSLKSKNYQMFHNGRTAWNGARYTPQVSSNRKGIMRIKLTGKGGKLGFDYAELAGIRRRPPRSRSKIAGTSVQGSSRGDGSYAYAGQGDAFISKLESDYGKPGRFAWKRIIQRRWDINRAVAGILEKYDIKLNAKLRGRGNII